MVTLDFESRQPYDGVVTKESNHMGDRWESDENLYAFDRRSGWRVVRFEGIVESYYVVYNREGRYVDAFDLFADAKFAVERLTSA